MKKLIDEIANSMRSAAEAAERTGPARSVQVYAPCVLAILDERDALKARVAEAEPECREEAKLNGKGSEREARLLGRIAELERALQKSRAILNEKSRPSVPKDTEAT
jgi:pyruvate/2-oxoacid:ferredoxin oxidoreductase beta subunit